MRDLRFRIHATYNPISLLTLLGLEPMLSPMLSVAKQHQITGFQVSVTHSSRSLLAVLAFRWATEYSWVCSFGFGCGPMATHGENMNAGAKTKEFKITSWEFLILKGVIIYL